MTVVVESPGSDQDSTLVSFRPRLERNYLLRRLFHSVIAVVGALSIVFFMTAATGNPARLMLPDDATEEQVAGLAAVYGFDQPLLVRYVKFIGQTVTGHFPNSIRYGVPAIDLVLARIPATLQLSGSALLLGTSLGLLLGYWLSSTNRILLSTAVLRLVVVLQAVPPFLLALILILVFSLGLHLLPTSGAGTYAHLVLPVSVFAITVVPGVARVFRATLLDHYTADHVSTALAKGIPLGSVRVRHVAINSLGPVLSYIGLQIGGLLGGAVVIETVFAYPGVGQLLVNSVNAKDFPVTLAAATVIAVGYVVTSFVVDVLHQQIDPRIRPE